MVKYVNINGMTFEMEVKKDNATYTKRFYDMMQGNYDMYHKYSYSNLYNCYEKPSTQKVNIFEYWQKEICNCRILSYNIMMFTCGGYIFDDNGNKYFTYITPSHNYIIPMVDF